MKLRRRINSVAPGTIYSDTAAKNYPEDVFGEAIKMQACGRLGTPEEVSSAVCFLLSPAAAFITGAEFDFLVHCPLPSGVIRSIEFLCVVLYLPSTSNDRRTKPHAR